MKPLGLTLLALVLPGPALPAQNPPAQTATGEYTRYELLEPGSGKFRILYEVWATSPGARYSRLAKVTRLDPRVRSAVAARIPA